MYWTHSQTSIIAGAFCAPKSLVGRASVVADFKQVEQGPCMFNKPWYDVRVHWDLLSNPMLERGFQSAVSPFNHLNRPFDEPIGLRVVGWRALVHGLGVRPTVCTNPGDGIPAGSLLVRFDDQLLVPQKFKNIVGTLLHSILRDQVPFVALPSQSSTPTSHHCQQVVSYCLCQHLCHP